MALIPLVLPPESVYVNSEGYVQQTRYSLHPTPSRLPQPPETSRLPQEALVTCTEVDLPMARMFVSNACGNTQRTVQIRAQKSVFNAIIPVMHADERILQFFKEAVMWKRLRHKNVVPLLGITLFPHQLISEWIPGGDLLENVNKPNADQLKLVGAS